MEFTKKYSKPNPRDSAGILSTLFFGFTIDIFQKGYKKKLEVNDLYSPLESDKSSILGDRLQKNWQKQLSEAKATGGRPSLFKSIAATFGTIYARTCFFVLISGVGLTIVEPMVLGGLLDYFKPEPVASKRQAYYYACAIATIAIIRILMQFQIKLITYHICMKARVAVCSLIYRKALKLSKTALGYTAAGKIVNLLSNDVSRFDSVAPFIQEMWSFPLCAIIVTVLIYINSGFAGLIGALVVIILAPLQSLTAKLIAEYRRQTAAKTDERVQLLDEIISGIQVIKMYAWEKPFGIVVEVARGAELKIITKSTYIRAAYMATNLFINRAALFSTLITLVISDQEITAAKILFLPLVPLSSHYSGASCTELRLFTPRFHHVFRRARRAHLPPSGGNPHPVHPSTRPTTVHIKQKSIVCPYTTTKHTIAPEQHQGGKPGKNPRYLETNEQSGCHSSLATALTVRNRVSFTSNHMKVYIMVSYFNILTKMVTIVSVRGFSEILELSVAIGRIQDFLMNKEFEVLESMHSLRVKDEEKILSTGKAVRLSGVNVKYDLCFEENVLESINLTVSQGELLGVIGPVGGGKSSLLQSILGELNVSEGTIHIDGKVSYASQEPWIFGATIRNNILFGLDYDKKRYQEVTSACALEIDFKQFQNRDLTIVGDRGASLSGGQKARINLARAVYREADIYLLDDPLSAVDIHVSKHLYEKCINGYLSKKTRILVTHQVHHLKNADHIVIVKNGRIDIEGTFETLASSDNPYAKLLSMKQEVSQDVALTDSVDGLSINSKSASIVSLHSKTSEADKNDDEGGDEEKNKPEDQQLLEKLRETSSNGKIEGSLLFKYLITGNTICSVFLMMLFFISTQFACGVVDYFVSYWVNFEEAKTLRGNQFYESLHTEKTKNILLDEGELHNSSVSTEIQTGDFSSLFSNLSTTYHLSIYGGCLASLLIMSSMRTVFSTKVVISSSRKLHSNIFKSVVGTSMRFFDITPVGRILNRFSSDMAAIDETLQKNILSAGQVLLSIAGSFVMVVIANPYFLIIVGFLGTCFGTMRHVYLRTSKDVKRIEGITKSPVFTHLKATLEGLTTVRAFGAEGTLINEFDHHQDHHTSASYTFMSTKVAFAFYLDLLCSIFTGLLSFSFLIFEETLQMRAGGVGLALSQAYSITGRLHLGMTEATGVSNQLVSVERVAEYETLPKEPQPYQPLTPPENWPSLGGIVFTDMSLRYIPDGPLVLANFNLKIDPKQKVGIVGRTGAGKILIDHSFIQTRSCRRQYHHRWNRHQGYHVENLRSRLSIIPQDPVLFSGTLRYNLDPFGEYSDGKLYKAMEDVELKGPANIMNRLENTVMDRGSNYSLGQRQLICLARAILKNNRILILDEATANVDPETDTVIQKTIRRKFSNCTVLTIAHKLNTIMDSDKVLVIESGSIVEFDNPYQLLQDSKSVFYKMAYETGKMSFEQLRKIACDSYGERIGVSK
ncbi:hypothetical protein JTB14_011985 [Gonioctena quinquepunctata]|nr:hypothetical protein JTB14_011985 [Gonioctena quinquepunctata]